MRIRRTWTFLLSGFLTLFFAWFARLPHAAAADGVFVSTGLLGTHVMSASGERSGRAGWAGGTYPQLGVGAKLPFPLLGGAWYVMPGLSYTVMGRELNDNAGKVNIWSLGLPFGTTVTFFDFKLGVGMFFYQYRGSGGTITLPDSADGSTTATYYRPHDSVTSKIFYTSLGAGVPLGDSFRFDLDVYINGILSLKRDFSFGAQLAYFFL